MSRPPSSLLKRLTIGLASGMVACVALGVGFWAVSTGQFSFLISQPSLAVGRKKLPGGKRDQPENGPGNLRLGQPQSIILNR